MNINDFQEMYRVYMCDVYMYEIMITWIFVRFFPLIILEIH